jgi:hypothetical protein
VAVNPRVYVPAVVGVPEIEPVVTFNDSPVGRAGVTAKEVGELVAET